MTQQDPRATVLAEERAVERGLVRKVLWGLVVAMPASILVCVGLITVAVASSHPDWVAWEGMAVFVGALVGTFFGVWAGFVASAKALDDVDRHASHPRP